PSGDALAAGLPGAGSAGGSPRSVSPPRSGRWFQRRCSGGARMIRKPLLIAAAATAVLVGGLAFAKADNLAPFGWTRPAVDEGAAHDRLIDKAAFTDVLARRAETLAMKPPEN